MAWARAKLAVAALLISGLALAVRAEDGTRGGARADEAMEPGRRIALVIGIDGYDDLPVLRNAIADARAVAAALENVGFEVLLQEDPDRSAFNHALHELATRVEAGDVAMLFYAGHAVQIDGANYLMPKDAPAVQPGGEALLISEAISLNAVLDQLAVEGARFNLIVLDACRDNPFAATGGRSVGGARGLALTSPPHGTFIIYSAGVNELALDRLGATDPDPNSVFTRVFLRYLDRPGLPVHEMVRQARAEVREIAASVGHSQNPAYYDQTTGDFYFVAAPTGARPEEPEPDAAVSTDSGRPAVPEGPMVETFRMTGRTVELITPGEIPFAMLDRPCAGRSDIVCVRVAGEQQHMTAGQQIQIAGAGGTCQLTLSALPPGENAAEFHLICPEEARSAMAAPVSRSFELTGGTTEFVTDQAVPFTLVATPCAGRGDIACVRLAGTDHFLGFGEQLEVVSTGSACLLTLLAIGPERNVARFHLAC